MKQRNPDDPLAIAIVATPEAAASVVYGIYEVMASVGLAWQLLHRQRPAPVFKPVVLSMDGQPFRTFNGLTIHPDGRFADHPSPDIVIIPDLAVMPGEPVPNTYSAIADWICGAHAKGAIVGSVCTGSTLLALTGLLDGEDATTHWAWDDDFRSRFPQIKLRKERVLVPAGEGHRIITAGSTTSWHDLLLYLIARVHSLEEARRIAKFFLLQWHADGQLPFASLTVTRQHKDPLIGAAQLWAADNYASANPVATMVEQSGLTERSFLRRFRAATGQSPIEYIQTLRIEEAKHLLETTETLPDDIAGEVGYAEASSFRRLFKKLVGLSPAAYRRRMLPPPQAFFQAAAG
ncbi:helix-turn-helix domain-containing protein [Mesorhizobium sp. M0938]|uniref:GlxA family transcriptional regulator n=1 Tax=unclassified Mesorhizobium TaxID=325217 RepID=UPI0033352125